LNDIERLLGIEDIKRLKARYLYAYDMQDWQIWRDEVWAPDGRLEVPEIELVITPRETMIQWVAAQARGQRSVHHGHTPIIDITGPSTATGIWAMEDRLYRTGENPAHGNVAYVHGFGHYHETYVRLDVGWRIASTRLTRLRVEHRSLESEAISVN
jgi:hypothetical protein